MSTTTTIITYSVMTRETWDPGNEVTVVGQARPNPEENDLYPVDAACRWTHPPRPPRKPCIASDDLGCQSQKDSVRDTLVHVKGFRNEGYRTARINHQQQQGPFREDNTPHLASMCFPWLFPDGTAVYVEPSVGAPASNVILGSHPNFPIGAADRPEEGAPHYRFASHRTVRY